METHEPFQLLFICSERCFVVVDLGSKGFEVVDAGLLLEEERSRSGDDEVFEVREGWEGVEEG